MSQDAQAGMTVLHVSAVESERASLRHLFGHSNWELRQVRTVGEAVPALAARPASVLICDRHAPGGGWRAMLNAALDAPWPPALIVAAGDPDLTFWAEALELGAYDVLWTPLSPGEVFAVIQSAWRARQEAARRSQSQTGQPQTSTARG